MNQHIRYVNITETEFANIEKPLFKMMSYEHFNQCHNETID